MGKKTKVLDHLPILNRHSEVKTNHAIEFPLFIGFNDTILFNNDLLKKNGIDADIADVKIDMQAYIEECVDGYVYYLNETSFPLSRYIDLLKFVSLPFDSYNKTTIYISIALVDDWLDELQRIINTNEEAFESLLNRYYLFDELGLLGEPVDLEYIKEKLFSGYIDELILSLVITYFAEIYFHKWFLTNDIYKFILYDVNITDYLL